MKITYLNLLVVSNTHGFNFIGEGEYICPVCTIFGLEDEEVQVLIDSGLKMTDHNIEDEGYEVEISAFKVRNASPYFHKSIR